MTQSKRLSIALNKVKDNIQVVKERKVLWKLHEIFLILYNNTNKPKIEKKFKVSLVFE